MNPLPVLLLRIPIQHPRPAKHQPENLLLGDGAWQLRHRPATHEEYHQRYLALKSCLYTGPTLFRGDGNTIPCAEFDTVPITCSLLLMRPTALRWKIGASTKGHRTIKATFTHHEHQYLMSVTDPIWDDRTAALRLGTYPRNICGITAKRDVWFVLSLSEPFENPNTKIAGYYKLVATVLIWPPV